MYFRPTASWLFNIFFSFLSGLFSFLFHYYICTPYFIFYFFLSISFSIVLPLSLLRYPRHLSAYYLFYVIHFIYPPILFSAIHLFSSPLSTSSIHQVSSPLSTSFKYRLPLFSFPLSTSFILPLPSLSTAEKEKTGRPTIRRQLIEKKPLRLISENWRIRQDQPIIFMCKRKWIIIPLDFIKVMSCVLRGRNFLLSSNLFGTADPIVKASIVNDREIRSNEFESLFKICFFVQRTSIFLYKRD